MSRGSKATMSIGDLMRQQVALGKARDAGKPKPRIVAECWTCGKPAAMYVRSDIFMHRGSGHDVREVNRG